LLIAWVSIGVGWRPFTGPGHATEEAYDTRSAMSEEVIRWGNVIKAANIKLQ
jgi:hypothetical protein